MVIQYASHQTLFIQALSEHIARNGLRVRILPYADFPGGQVVRIVRVFSSHARGYWEEMCACQCQPALENTSSTLSHVRVMCRTSLLHLQYHHKKELMNKISTREYLPYTFHMCWCVDWWA